MNQKSEEKKKENFVQVVIDGPLYSVMTTGTFLKNKEQFCT